MTEQEGGTRSAAAVEQRTEVAVLAGGCFWGVEDILRDVTGGWLIVACVRGALRA